MSPPYSLALTLLKTLPLFLLPGTLMLGSYSLLALTRLDILAIAIPIILFFTSSAVITKKLLARFSVLEPPLGTLGHTILTAAAFIAVTSISGGACVGCLGVLLNLGTPTVTIQPPQTPP